MRHNIHKNMWNKREIQNKGTLDNKKEKGFFDVPGVKFNGSPLRMLADSLCFVF